MASANPQDDAPVANEEPTAATIPANAIEDEPEPEWNFSDEKKVLTKDIVDGIVPPEMPPSEIYNMHDGIYHQWRDYPKWRDRVRRLRNKIHKDLDRKTSDEQAFASDSHLRTAAAKPHSRPYPRWDGSEAQRLLKTDIENGLHKQMTPKPLRETRQEYQEFPLPVFAGHIGQEVRSLTESPYWMAKTAQKRAKRASKARKKAAKATAPRKKN